MFFDARLMKSKTIGSVWKSAHKFRETNQKSGPPFNKICANLEQWVHCEDEVASRRLSLRTSSTLLSGAASLYKRKLEELLADLQYTADSMRGAKCSRRQSWQSPDELAHDSGGFDSKTLEKKSKDDHRSSSTSRKGQDPEHPEMEPEKVGEVEMSSEDLDLDESPSVGPKNGGQEIPDAVNNRYSQRSSTDRRKNANTQTSMKDLNTEDADPDIHDSEGGRAEPQPFVCAIIYESNKTAVPTNILLSSVNPEILKLFE